MQKINKLSFQAFWLLMMVLSVSACKKEEAVAPTPLAAPVASFGFPNTGLNAPCDVIFTNITTGESVSYQWDFGDGGVSADKAPTHRYNTQGTYTVTLTASNSGGSNSTTKVIVIAPAVAPVANFTFTSTNSTAPASVVFTNTTVGSGSYIWDFGDGGTSTEANPTHLYNTAGTYTVRMTVTNSAGSDVAVKTVNIQSLPITYTKCRVTKWALLQIPYTVYSLFAENIDHLGNTMATSYSSGSANVGAGNMPYLLEMVNSNYITDITQTGYMIVRARSSANGGIYQEPIPFKAIDYRPTGNTPTATSEATINAGGAGVKVYMEWAP